MSVKLVIFDMDGVVIDSEKVYFRSNQLAAEELGIKGFTMEYYRQFVGADVVEDHALHVVDIEDTGAFKLHLQHVQKLAVQAFDDLLFGPADVGGDGGERVVHQRKAAVQVVDQPSVFRGEHRRPPAWVREWHGAHGGQTAAHPSV